MSGRDGAIFGGLQALLGGAFVAIITQSWLIATVCFCIAIGTFLYAVFTKD